MSVISIPEIKLAIYGYGIGNLLVITSMVVCQRREERERRETYSYKKEKKYTYEKIVTTHRNATENSKKSDGGIGK